MSGRNADIGGPMEKATLGERNTVRVGKHWENVIVVQLRYRVGYSKKRNPGK
jgi:hypothetical protein